MTKARMAQGKGGSQPPISAHPAFPAIVALWFAALFGIGSLVLPNILIEKVIDATGLASVIPAAAPPIGFTAKLTLAFIVAGVGVLAGLFIARKVVETQAAPKQARKVRKAACEEYEVPAKRPIVATEELGEEGLGPVRDADDHAERSMPASKPPMPGRRRALSVTDDSGPSPYLAHVPLPGEAEPLALNEPVLTMAAETFSLDAGKAFAVADPANRRDGSNVIPDPEQHSYSAAADNRPFDAPLAFPAQQAMGGDSAQYQASVEQEATHPLDLGTLDLAQPQREAQVEPQQDLTMNSNSFSGEPGMGAGYNPFGDRAAQPIEQSPAPAFGVPQAPAQVFASQAFAPTSFAAPAIPAAAAPAAPLAELSMSELIARFARSMQGADPAPVAAPATPASTPAPQVLADDPFEDAAPAVPFAFARPAMDAPVAAPAAEARVAMPPFALPASVPTFAAPAAQQQQAVPAALRPLDLGAFEEDDAEDDPFAATPGFSFGAPERMFERPAEVPAATAPFAAPTAPAMPAAFADPLAGAEDEEDSGNDDSYSSLLSMKSPLGNHREFPRIEDEDHTPALSPEPVVVFPGQVQAASPGVEAHRPFDAPPAMGGGGLARAVPTMPAQKPADPAETERALRDALEKLQRMSGAA